MEARRWIVPTAAAVGQARRFAVTTLTRWGLPDDAATAELLVSELVTNGVLHGRSTLELVLTRAGDRLCVRLYDGEPARPRQKRPGPSSAHGRGLVLVDRLAERWGYEPTRTGKCVWFELRISGPVARRSAHT